MSTRAPHSFTTWKLIASVAVALTIGTVCLAQETAKKDDPAVAGVAAVMRSYMAAFNKNDAPALAALWAAEGVYTDGHSGERTTGRAALLADFQKTFKDYPGARLTASSATPAS